MWFSTMLSQKMMGIEKPLVAGIWLSTADIEGLWSKSAFHLGCFTEMQNVVPEVWLCVEISDCLM